MKKLFNIIILDAICLIPVVVGMVLSIPITILLIAVDQAMINKEKIRKHLDDDASK